MPLKQDVVELEVDRRNVVEMEFEIEWIRQAMVMRYSSRAVFLVDLMIDIVMVVVDLRCWFFEIVDASLLPQDVTEMVVEMNVEIGLEWQVE